MRTDVLMCEVSDDDHHLPTLRPVTDTDEAGRGLILVSRLAQRWGANRTNQGKAVWFELALGPGCARTPLWTGRSASGLEQYLDGGGAPRVLQRQHCLVPALEREAVRDDRRQVEAAGHEV